jgi:hypothetical protein
MRAWHVKSSAEPSSLTCGLFLMAADSFQLLWQDPSIVSHYLILGDLFSSQEDVEYLMSVTKSVRYDVFSLQAWRAKNSAEPSGLTCGLLLVARLLWQDRSIVSHYFNSCGSLITRTPKSERCFVRRGEKSPVSSYRR